MLQLSRFRDSMARCTHCGLCQAVCPVYLEDCLQTHLARARIDLIRAALLEGSIPVTKRLREVVKRCLLCTCCSQACAAQIPIDEIVAAARSRLYEGIHRNPARRFLLHRTMARRGVSGLPAKAGLLALRMGWLPRDLPVPTRQSFEQRFRGTHLPEGKRRLRVAYFVGCATNTFFPETGEAVLKVLRRNGIEVVVPTGLACCGIPCLAEGDLTSLQEMVQTNLGVLSSLDVDAIVTDCTSCGMMFKLKTLSLFLEGDPGRGQAESVSGKFWEVTDFLCHVGLDRRPGALAESFTYHVPCHRSWTATVNDAPRVLLGAVPQARLVEQEDPQRCCGAGGVFFAEFRDLAEKIRSRKIDDIRQTGTTTVLTQCPACRAFLGASLRGFRCMHPVSFLARAYGS